MPELFTLTWPILFTVCTAEAAFCVVEAVVTFVVGVVLPANVRTAVLAGVATSLCLIQPH